MESLEKFIIFLVVCSIALIAWQFVAVNWITGQGVSTDYVTGVQTAGVFWKTTDIYLRNEHPSSAITGKYCLPINYGGCR
jgi:hypothetical protein